MPNDPSTQDCTDQERKNYPTFGSLLRGARLGFHYVPKLDAWVRISASGWMPGSPAAWELQVIATPLRKGLGVRGEHVVWWDDDAEGERLLRLCPALRAMVGRRIDFETFVVDDDGNEAKLHVA